MKVRQHCRKLKGHCRNDVVGGVGMTSTPSSCSSSNGYPSTRSAPTDVLIESVEERLDASLDKAGRSCDKFELSKV